MFLPKPPAPIEKPVWVKVCGEADEALLPCAGVPVRKYSGRKALTLGLGEALRALRDCKDKNRTLVACITKHNQKAAGQ